TERGISLCCPIHDAVLIEAADDEIDDAVALTRRCMGEASRLVLDGLVVPTDAEVIRYPHRYVDHSWTAYVGVGVRITPSRETSCPPRRQRQREKRLRWLRR